ncbi:MAG: diguanylate cyclase [Candidatus Izemoplasmatales bacterium]|nr:diguanylate cyclase [bacterium]MDZ4197028.1 diguanylate cyclase [Candidatus Izemoplasmatales bacterium]
MKPFIRNLIILAIGSIIITAMNVGIIVQFGILLYTRFYFLTLLLPYILLYWFFAIYKGAQLIFSLLSTQVIGSVAILNGLFASYVFFGQNTLYIDTIARSITYLLFLPIVLKFIRPTYVKMLNLFEKGWWVLNVGLILAYVLAYVILFVPNPIFERPVYFIHAYVGVILTSLIYVVIFFLFIQVQTKTVIEQDKLKLSRQVNTLAQESAEIRSIAYKDSLTGINNRFSLLRQMDLLTQNGYPFLIIFMDLDDLKEINDTYDHSKGDACLQQFALALQRTIAHQGDAYRFAGDEFVCLVTKNVADFNMKHFRENVEKEMQTDIPYKGMSLGIAYYPEDGSIPDDLISIADLAMYIEKKEKKRR